MAANKKENLGRAEKQLTSQLHGGGNYIALNWRRMAIKVLFFPHLPPFFI